MSIGRAARTAATSGSSGAHVVRSATTPILVATPRCPREPSGRSLAHASQTIGSDATTRGRVERRDVVG